MSAVKYKGNFKPTSSTGSAKHILKNKVWYVGSFLY